MKINVQNPCDLMFTCYLYVTKHTQKMKTMKQSKAQRRIAIVKDAITQLQIGTYKTGDFGYISIPNVLNNKRDTIKSAQELLADDNLSQVSCGICAKGSLLLSTICKENEFDSINLVNRSSVVMERLTEDNLFEKKNLDLIEAYYEGAGWVVGSYYVWSGGAGDGFSSYLKTSGHLDNIKKFENEYPDELEGRRTKRLLAILKNMEENDGVFKPVLE